MYELLLAAVLVLAVLYFRKGRYRKLPPGPGGPPFIGVSRQLQLTTLHETMSEWEKKYGSIYYFTTMGVSNLVLSDPSLVRRAYSSARYQDIFNDRNPTFSGKHIVWNFKEIGCCRYNEDLAKMRKMMHKGLHFYGEGVARFEHLVTENLAAVVDEIKSHEGEEIDPKPIVHESLVRVIVILMTGEAAREGDRELIDEYCSTLNRVLNPGFDTVMMALPFLKYLPSSFRSTYLDMIRTRDDVIRRFYDTQKASHEAGKEKGLIHSLMTLQTSTGVTDYHVRGLVLDVVGGGVLTSTYTMLATILTLAHNQQCYKRLKEEVDCVVGRDRPPIFSDRSYMPYTEATILEVLRYTTLFPYIPHRCMSDVEFEGYTISEGTQVIANTWTINHDETLWKDPWTFNPERFLDDDGMLYDANDPIRQRLLSFGVGKRGCVGESLAFSRLFLYVATLAQQFDILPSQGAASSPDPRHYDHHGTVHTPPPYKCRFIAR